MTDVRVLARNENITLPCEDEHPDLMFPHSEEPRRVSGVKVDNPDVEAAKQVCRRCPLRSTCLDGAVERREQHGIWGGMTTVERESMMRKSRRHAVMGDLSLLEAV